MKIFASVDLNYLPISFGHSNSINKKKFIYGAWVGGDNFYSALLRHGHFDEYHLFVDSEPSARLLKKKIARLTTDPQRVKIKKLSELVFSLKNTKYTVLFTATPYLSLLASLRLKYAKEYFPLCSLIFETISYPGLLHNVFFQNIAADLHPFDSIICTSQAVYTAIKNLHSSASNSLKKITGASLQYGGRLDCLPFGINADDFARISRDQARKKLGLPQDKIIILYFGRFSLHDKADLFPLLLVFKKILAQGKNVILLCAGTDRQTMYGAKVKKMAEEMKLSQNIKFIFENFIQDKHLLYSASDIFVSPSDSVQESFGFTVLEAMASGLPVVVSDWDGYKDLVQHNKTGFCIPTYGSNSNADLCDFYTLLERWQENHLYLAQSVCVDAGKMHEYLLTLVEDKALRLKLGNNARKIILEKYNWNILLPAYEKLWIQLSRMSKNYKIRQDKSKVFMFDYAATFAHYPTAILNKQTRMSISENGLLFLKSKKLPFEIPRLLLDVISLKVIFIILLFLREAKTSTLAKIEKYVKEVVVMESKGDIRFQIMWLLKKDLLRVQC